jgi:hypothetical protein
MPITEDNLMLEVGSEVLDELTAKEKATILAKYSIGQEKVAAMRVFYIAAMKFKPSYKMGSTFEDLSAKYRKYWDMYCFLAHTVNAGRTTGNNSANNTVEVDRWKWPGQTR